MPLLLAVPEAYAAQVLRLLATSRTTIPVEVVDSSSLAADWATVLAVGNTSGGTDATISAGDSLVIDPGALVKFRGAQLIQVAGGATLAVSVGSGAPKFEIAIGQLTVGVAPLEWKNGFSPFISQATGGSGSPGAPFTVQAQSGVGTTSGDLNLFGGTGIGGGATGGNFVGRGGTGTTPGQAHLAHASGAVAVRVSQNPTGGHLGGQAIHATSAGLGFFDGTPVERPNVSGSRAGNAALASLLSTLDSMGLITDTTT